MTKNKFDEFTDDVESHGKYHSPDCEHAHTPRCRCWCHGKYHGAKTGILAVISKETVNRDMLPDYQVITEDFGGQAGKQVLKLLKNKFTCLGVCGKEIAASPMIGKPHDGGFADSKGFKWWLFIICPYCGYETALWKIAKRLKK